MAIPPLFDLVERTAEEFIQRWKGLDDRKVIAHVDHHQSNEGDEIVEDEVDNGDDTSRQKRRRYDGWYDRHVRFPYSFDYASRREEPPEDSPGGDDRIISLEDPTKTQSYERELWRLFRDILKAEQLEQRATNPHQMLHTASLCKQMAEDAGASDSFALSRLRMNDRHDLVLCKTNSSIHFVPTIRWECWRRQLQPRRGSLPDPNRMVVELLGTQTLLDLHQIIIEQWEDSLWERDNSSSNRDSGYFFIEGAFYTHGGTDYVTSIQNIMARRAGSSKRGEQTAAYGRMTMAGSLEVAPSHPVYEMENTCLYDLVVRLNVRYYHCCHGDLECSVFCSDFRLSKNTANIATTYPIFHDVWTPPASIPMCEGCQQAAAVLATSTECTLTDGHRMLCHACATRLHLYIKAPQDLEAFDVWRFEVDNSNKEE